jgi:hypothetical protein
MVGSEPAVKLERRDAQEALCWPVRRRAGLATGEPRQRSSSRVVTPAVFSGEEEFVPMN